MTYAAAPRRPGTIVDFAEVGACVLSLVLMSQALLQPIFVPDQSQESPEWMRLMWLPVYGATMLMLAARLGRLGSLWVGLLLTAPLILLAFASTEWSVVPDATMRRSIALLFTSLFGFYLAARFDWRDLIQLLAAVFLALAVGSFVAAVLFPDFGTHTADEHAGAWRGLWGEKNSAGAMMVRGALACACAAVVTRRYAIWAPGAVLCAFLVVASTSTTALLGLVIAIGGMAGVRVLRSGGLGAVSGIWLGGLVVVVVAGLLLTAPDVVFQALGKDATLTGRTDIWESVARYAEQRPQGYGYGAFWEGSAGPVTQVREELQWPVPNAHSGWLELLLAFGKVGVALFVVHFATTAFSAASRLWAGGPEAYFALPATLIFLLFSISESTILQQNNLTWVIYVAVFAKLLQVRAAPASALAHPGWGAVRRTSATP